MKYIPHILLIGVLTIILTSTLTSAVNTDITATKDTVNITVASQGLRVEENIGVTNSGTSNVTALRFWLQQNARDIQIQEKKSGKELAFTNVNEYVRECNLSSLNLTILASGSLEVVLVYYLPTTTNSFEKTFQYTTAQCTVTYNNRNLFQGEHLGSSDSNNAITVLLTQPTEAPLSTLSLIIIFGLVVILFAVLFLSLRSQRAKIKRGALVESEETLITKKALLLELLKELEKQSRAKSISDETYTKLKGEYKQQAVDTMKKLDDIKK